MKLPKFLTSSISLLLVKLISILLAINAFATLASVFFNIKPYLEIGNISIGNLEYEKGIPVLIQLNSKGLLPDTIYHINSNKGHGSYSVYNNEPLNNYKKVFPDSSIISRDTFAIKLELNTAKGNTQSNIVINSMKLNEAAAYIRAKNISTKLLFCVPIFITLLLLSFCLWQFSLLLNFIQLGQAFIYQNAFILKKIGFSIIIYQIILIAIHILRENIIASATLSYLNKDFQVFNIYGQQDNSINIVYFFVGGAILTLSQAFQRGYKLQQEQDLTI